MKPVTFRSAASQLPVTLVQTTPLESQVNGDKTGMGISRVRARPLEQGHADDEADIRRLWTPRAHRESGDTDARPASALPNPRDAACQSQWLPMTFRIA